MALVAGDQIISLSGFSAFEEDTVFGIELGEAAMN